MKKFKCVETGAVLLVTNDFTIKQFIKSNKYEEVKETIKKNSSNNKNN